MWLIVFTILLAPAYTYKFVLNGLPTNLLMVWLFLVWLIFFSTLFLQKQFSEFVKFVKNTEKKVFVLIVLFFLAGIISLFLNGLTQAKLGQFIVLFLQPLSLFFIAKFIFEKNSNQKHFLLLTFYFLLALAGLYAIIQYFTLFGLPPAYWGNSVEPKRAVSFFSHPNFYALFSAPLLALLVPDLGLSLKSKILNLKSILWFIGGAGLLLSFSRAGWLGLAAAIGIYLLIAADKKIRKIIFTAVIVIVIVIVSTPNLRFRFTLPFYGEKSAVSRLSLWHTGAKAIKEAPIFGLGLTGFSNNWARLNTDPNLETHNFPHNIFLNFWVETGLLGLISFFSLIGIYIYKGIKNRNNIYYLSIALFLVALVTQGLIDNPYFKNDLSVLFWIFLALF